MLLVAAGSNSVQQSRTMLQVVVNTGCFCLLHGACVARQQQLGRATTQQQQQQSAVVACMSGVCLHYLSPSRGTTGAQCSVHVHLPCLNMSTHMCC